MNVANPLLALRCIAFAHQASIGVSVILSVRLQPTECIKGDYRKVASLHAQLQGIFSPSQVLRQNMKMPTPNT
jgi:hypothetical protein